MNIETGREFGFTNPQDDPQLYPRPPSGFRYNIDGTLQAIPFYNSAVNRPFQPPRTSQNRVYPTPTTTNPAATLNQSEIQYVLQNGQFLPDARGPGKITYCDVCRKSNLKQSIAYRNYDICLDCAQKYK